MRSQLNDFVIRNRWGLLFALIVLILISLASYSIEKDKHDITTSMEYKAKIEALYISSSLSIELDEVTSELLSMYDVKISSPPQDQQEFSTKTKPLLEKNAYLSSIYYINTDKDLVFKVPTDSNTPPDVYKGNNSILEIAMLVADHTNRPYLSAPYDITPGVYYYSLVIPYENHSFFQLTFSCEDVFAHNSTFRQNDEILIQVVDDNKVVYSSPNYKSQLAHSDAFLTTSQISLYKKEMLLDVLPSDATLSTHVQLWESFGHGSLYLILLILLLIVLFQMFDINERKEHQRKLKRSENKFKSLFNYVNDVIYINDLQGNFLEANIVTCEKLGYSKDELLKMNRWEIMLHHSPDETDKKINAVLKHKEYISETVHVSRDGTLIPVELNSRLINYEGQEAIINIARDLSDNKRAEMLLESNNELRQLTRMKDLFTDILRHDLLGPASVIKGYTEILLETTEDSQKKELLDKILQSDLKLIELIDNAAKLAKFESIEELDFKITNLYPLLISVIDNYQVQFKAKNISLNLPIKQEYNALINPIIAEVFANILSNAIKYSPSNSEIDIKVEDEGSNWKIFVIDSGEGVQVSDREQIFDRFSRAHKGGVKGTGLGLAIAKRIMDLHGGSIGVDDNPAGNGSVFWFSIRKKEK